MLLYFCRCKIVVVLMLLNKISINLCFIKNHKEKIFKVHGGPSIKKSSIKNTTQVVVFMLLSC